MQGIFGDGAVYRCCEKEDEPSENGPLILVIVLASIFAVIVLTIVIYFVACRKSQPQRQTVPQSHIQMVQQPQVIILQQAGQQQMPGPQGRISAPQYAQGQAAFPQASPVAFNVQPFAAQAQPVPVPMATPASKPNV